MYLTSSCVECSLPLSFCSFSLSLPLLLSLLYFFLSFLFSRFLNHPTSLLPYYCTPLFSYWGLQCNFMASNWAVGMDEWSKLLFFSFWYEYDSDEYEVSTRTFWEASCDVETCWLFACIFTQSHKIIYIIYNTHRHTKRLTLACCQSQHR